MKTSVYMKDGDTQLILTPENAVEEELMKSLSKLPNRKHLSASVTRSEFYLCNGGHYMLTNQGKVDSLIINLHSESSQEVE